MLIQISRRLPVLLTLCTAAGSAAAQCVPPSASTQSLQTTMGGNFLFGGPTPPLFGVSQDPGPSYRCDLTLDAPVSITAVGCSLWNDGQLILGIPTPNLIGVPGGQIEMWVLPGGTVTNAANYTVPYTRGTTPGVPAAGPDTAIGWTRAGVGSLSVSPLGIASMATFATPISLAAGTYAVELVLVAPYGPTAGTNAIRIHPRLTSIPVSGLPLTFADQIVTIDHTGTTDPAFTPGSLNHLSAPPNGPFLADIRFDYTVGPIAFSTKYGVGCYDQKRSFYESFNGAAVPGGSAPNVTTTGLTMTPVGAPVSRYLVQPAVGTYPLTGTPGSTTHYTLLGATTPTHVNSVAPAVGGPLWDDANSVLYPLPFPLNHPGGTATQISIGSNGVVYLGTTTGALFFYDNFDNWLSSGGASFAVAFGDLSPAGGGFGTGDIYIDSDGATFVTVSWVNVQEYPGTTNFTTGNNFQVRFDVGGAVTYAYGSLRNSDVAPLLIGYTEGAIAGIAAADPGAGQAPPRIAVPQPAGGVGPFVTALPFLTGNGSRAPSIRLDKRPKHGSNLAIVVENLDPSVQAVMPFIAGASLPGIDLGQVLGMPGCSAFVLLPPIVSGLNFTLGSPSVTVTFGAIPPVGPLNVFAQAACLSNAVPTFNGPNILVSDAVCIHIDAN